MSKQITIPAYGSGGTLSELAQKYNTSVGELMKMNPTIQNPDKIYAGASLNVPELSNTLNKKTSPTGKELPYSQTEEKTLPDNGAADNLSNFKLMLNQIASKNAASRKSTVTNKFQDMGFDPNKVSGGTMYDVLKYIKDTSSVGIENQYDTALETVNDIADRSQSGIDKLISSGALGDVNDEMITRLSAASGIDTDILMALRDAKQVENNKPYKTITTIKDGQEYLQGFDETGKKLFETATGGVDKDDEKENIRDRKTFNDDDEENLADIQENIDTNQVSFEDAVAVFPEFANYLEKPLK